MLKGLAKSADTRGLSYVLVWRNANPLYDRKDHYYAPFPGQKSAPDFVRFYNHPLTWFETDLPDMYAAIPKKD